MMVYISEAHALDVWPLGETVCVKQHKSIEERIETAKKYVVEDRENKIPTFVDTFENEFDKVYSAWPERFFILCQKKIEFIAQPSLNDLGFDRNQIVEWLDKYKEDIALKITN